MVDEKVHYCFSGSKGDLFCQEHHFSKNLSTNRMSITRTIMIGNYFRN